MPKQVSAGFENGRQREHCEFVLPLTAVKPTGAGSVIGANHAALTQGGRGVSDSARTKRVQGAVSCPRCGTTMEEVVSIAPTLGEPGLVAYECPNCVYVTSELVRPKKRY